MPNQVKVEIYIKRSEVESILADTEVTHVLAHGSIDVTDDTTCEWNIKAVGYSAAEAVRSTHPTCPQPCP